MNIQSFESELFEVMGLESHLEYDCSIESTMIYDDNFIQYTQEMVGITVLIAASESVMFSMEFDGDNIIVRFFKFVINLCKKIINGIVNFVKWVGNGIKTFFVGPPKDYHVKISKVKTMTKEEVNVLVESKRIKSDVMVLNLPESKKIAESRATFHKQVADNIDKNQKIIDDLSKDTKKLSEGTPDIIKKMREDSDELKVKFDSEKQSLKDKHAERKSSIDKMENHRDEKNNSSLGILSTEIVSVHDYIKNIDKYDLSLMSSNETVKGIAQLQYAQATSTKKRIEALQKSVDELIKISEEVWEGNNNNTKRKSGTTPVIEGGRHADGVGDSLHNLKELKHNISKMLELMKDSLNENSGMVQQLMKCRHTCDKFSRILIMATDKDSPIRAASNDLHFQNEDRKAAIRRSNQQIDHTKKQDL